MIIKCEINTDDLYHDEDGYQTSMESLLSDSLKRSIVEESKKNVASDQFKKFAQLTSDTIVADIKLRMENFLSEEIVLTGDWGKKVWVGSVEDLIKKRFDEILLRPVNDSGKTLEGCTTQGHKTWIEWTIENELKTKTKRIIENAIKTVEKSVSDNISKLIIDLKEKSIADQVKDSFSKLLK